MARIRKHLRLVDIAKDNGGIIALDNPEVQKVLANGTAYRLPSYVWDIKHYSQLEVTAVRQGRKIVAYELPAIKALASASEATSVPAAVSVSDAPTVIETLAESNTKGTVAEKMFVEVVESAAV